MSNRFMFLTRNGIADAGQEPALDALRDSLNGASPKMLLHLHGGLVPEAAGVAAATRLGGAGEHSWTLAADWTQVYFVWRGGFEASARFERTGSSNWVRILIRVTGPASDGSPVQFYLHDSFRPLMREAKFRGYKAQIAVTAWGGFTVGVWIPDRQVELELDLAKAPKAPSIVRTR